MKKIMRTLCVFCLSLLAMSSYAIIDLELTQGVAASIPLAFSVQQSEATEVNGRQSMGEVIRNDLQNSGEFRVVNSAQDQSAVDMTAWRRMGADYAVTGEITQHGDSFRVHVQLSTVFNKDKNAEDALLDAVFTASRPALRGLAHRISDEIYQKLTGVRGIFSTKIAYVVVTHPTAESSRYMLEIADADGFNAQTLLASDEPIMSPAWTPDGRQLAYVSFEGHHAAIYKQDLATGQRVKLSAAPGINGAPSFSPDGRYMAMVLSKSGNPNIYLLDLSSKRYRAMTPDWYIDTEPTFAADGRSFLFTSNREGSPQIYKYVIATGQISRVTYKGNYNARPVFVPNSGNIVMMHREEHTFGIASLNLASQQLQTLVQTGVDESPSVAPNGKMVIYATEYGGRGILAQVSVDGRIKLRLPARDGAVQEPVWSPFLNV